MREMKLVDRPVLYPMTCACGSQMGPLVDTQITGHVGRLYLCPRCVETMAHLHGYQTPAEVVEREVILEGLLVKVATLEQELAQALDQRVISVDELRAELTKPAPS